MTPAEEALIVALIGAAPGIGRWIGGLINGNDEHPMATQRVRDILPEKSASQAAVDELRGFALDEDT